MAYHGHQYNDSVYSYEVTTSGSIPSTLAPDDGSYSQGGVALAPYTTTMESYHGYQGSPAPLSQGHTGSTHGSSGYYVTDANWASSNRAVSFSQSTANPYNYSYQNEGSDSYGNSTDTYGYGFHQGQGDYSMTAQQAAFPVDNTQTMGSIDPSSTTASRSSNHRAYNRKESSASSPSSSSSSSSSSSKKSKHKFPVLPSSSTSSPGPGKSKLRSASRTSKNTHHNPPANDEERKNRESHNQVEKQYRNRLNAHFESLLSALPEDMRTEEDEDGNGGGLDLTDRRVSKAEVLGMARRHIKALEKECATLEGERDELRENMERLRYLFGRCQDKENTEGR